MFLLLRFLRGGGPTPPWALVRRSTSPSALEGSAFGRAAEVVARAALRWRRSALALVILATAFFACFLPGLRVDPDLEKTFPERDPRLAEYRAAREVFGADEDVALCVVEFPGSVLELEGMERVHQLTEALRAAPWVDEERLVSLSSAGFVRVDEEGGIDVGPLYEPSRRAGWDPAALDRRLAAHPAFDQRLVSRDRRLAGFWVPMAPGARGEEDREAFVASLRRFFSPGGALRPGERAFLEGTAVAREELEASILGDTWRLLPLAFLALLGALALLYRELTAPLLALLVVGASVTWTVGGMSLFGVPFGTLSACIPVMVLVSSVGDVVHLLSRYRLELRRGRAQPTAVESAVLHVTGPCLLTSLTTAAGFASLGLSQVAVLREFGLPVACGVLAAFLVTLGGLPALLLWLPAPRPGRGAGPLARVGAFADRASARRPWALVLATLGLVLGSALCLPSLSREARLLDDLDPDSSLVRTRRLLEERFGGAASLDLVVDAGAPGAALRPEVERGVLALTETLRGEEFRAQGVLSAISLPDFLSDAYRTWNAAEEGGGDGGRAPALPDTAEALAQLHFLFWFSDRDPTAGLVDDASDPRRLRVRLRLRDGTTSEFFALAKRVEAAARRCLPGDVDVRLTGTTYMARLVSESLVREMLESALCAVALVGGLVWAFFGSFRLAALGVLGSALPLVLVLGVMALTGTPLTLSTSIVFALAFGISIDDTVHLLSGYRQRCARGPRRALSAALRESGQALVYSTLALVLGFGVLGASSFPANRVFAALLALTLVLALAADLFFLPALLRLGPAAATAPRRVPRAFAGARPFAPGWGLRPRALPALSAEGPPRLLPVPVRCAWRAGLAGLATGPPSRGPPPEPVFVRSRAPPAGSAALKERRSSPGNRSAAERGPRAQAGRSRRRRKARARAPRVLLRGPERTQGGVCRSALRCRSGWGRRVARGRSPCRWRCEAVGSRVPRSPRRVGPRRCCCWVPARRSSALRLRSRGRAARSPLPLAGRSFPRGRRANGRAVRRSGSGFVPPLRPAVRPRARAS
ncbi:MAG: hypothetical protein D6731_07940 [Planctomycetota bacterium]|nr:MAG: hypothetical protein D6731_07940 [Planctomycetota bacterium]